MIQTVIAVAIVLAAAGYLAWVWAPVKVDVGQPSGAAGDDRMNCAGCSSCARCG